MPFSFPEFSFPVAIFLGLYGFFLLFYVIYALFNISHLLEYGRIGSPLWMIVVVFTGGTIFLVGGSIIWLLQYDLFYSIPLSEVLDTLSQIFLRRSLS
jgi:hypothetical protein